MRVIVPGDRVKVTNRLHPRIKASYGPYGGVPSLGEVTTIVDFLRTVEILIGVPRATCHWKTADIDYWLWKGGWPCD